MRALALVGLVALGFGVGSYYALGELGAFGLANLGVGAIALAIAGVRGLLRARDVGADEARRVLVPHALWLAAVLAAAIAAERAASAAHLRFDWTVGRRYELAPATREALAALPGPLRATLYYEDYDPRTRRVRLLLDTLAQAGPVETHQRRMAEAKAEVDRFDLAFSNSVVLELGDEWTVVERPSEGTLLEGLRRLTHRGASLVYVTRGEGEGDLESTQEAGLSGLAAQLEGEGYRVRELVLSAVREVPEDAAAVLVLAPQRRFRDEAIEALDRYVRRGGRLVAFLEPGRDTGVEGLLARYGLEVPDGVVVDEAAGPVEGLPRGVAPIVYSYGSHPITRGLSPRTMTFFLRARPVVPARKPEPEDQLVGLAFSSPRAWLAVESGAIERGLAPLRPEGVQPERFPLAAAGLYPRDGVEGRIVAFGDADFASNHYLRTLYNLDLLLNAMHWVLSREDAITLRPKQVTQDQDPLTPQQSLSMLYGVGLLLPELLLVAAALAWVRQRTG